MNRNDWWNESGLIIGYLFFLVWWVRWYFHCFPYYLREKEGILWRVTKWEWEQFIRRIDIFILGLNTNEKYYELLEKHNAINKDMNELQEEINEVFGLGR